MINLRRHLLDLVLVSMVLVPMNAFASGAPTPTPRATQRASATPAPPAPTPLPFAPTPVPPQSTPPAPTPTAEPSLAPATSVAPAAPAPMTEPGMAPLASSAEAAPSPTPVAIAEDAFSVWHGVVREAGAFRRSGPTSAAEVIEELDPGTPIRVERWVGGSMLYPDVITWGQVDPADGGGYIFGGSLQGALPPSVPPPAEDLQNSDRTWIDVNLTLNVVTVYEAGQPVKMMLTSPGRPGHETDVGRFAVRTKLPSQTMSGPGYVVPGVPSVEYFYGGEALHGRYWTLPDVSSQQTSADVDDNGLIQALDDGPMQTADANRGVAFGVPSSHGCLGMEVSAAAWLYGMTSFGTPVDVHY